VGDQETEEQKLELSLTYCLMKSYRKELWFEANQRRQFFRITPQIEQCLEESGVTEGLVLVNAMHITASVFINDDELFLSRAR
jgi:thiamine phosphate synthase YjbQ (UPF0047 family)